MKVLILVLFLMISNAYAKEDFYVVPQSVIDAHQSMLRALHGYFFKIESRFYELRDKQLRTIQEEDEFKALSLIVSGASDKELDLYLTNLSSG